MVIWLRIIIIISQKQLPEVVSGMDIFLFPKNIIFISFRGFLDEKIFSQKRIF
jgi:hypothetical protein